MTDEGARASQRVAGLDWVRSIAILLVLTSHGRHFFERFELPHWNWWWLSVGGYLGVELFFVLSGFLIGRILVREVWSDAPAVGRRLKTFWFRRWTRTLPLYFVALAVAIWLQHQHGGPDWSWRHFLFVQNFSDTALQFFGVSWSLSVEEWFYLVVPVVGVAWLWTLRRHCSAPAALAGLMFAVVAGTLVARGLAVHAPAAGDWTHLRKAIFLRFDAFAWGILAALAERSSPRWAARLRHPAAFALGVALQVGLVAFYYLEGDAGLDASWFGRVAMLPLTSLACALVLLFVAERAPTVRALSAVSLWSYALYLFHPFFFEPALAWAAGQGAGASALALLAALAGVFTLAWAAHRWFERPLLAWRDRVTASTRAAQPLHG